MLPNELYATSITVNLFFIIGYLIRSLMILVLIVKNS